MPSGNQFSSSGVRVLRINCSGNGFLDMSSVCLRYTLTNNSGTDSLQPLTADGGNWFSELRILASGIVAEQIGGGSCGYDRVLAALNLGLPIGKRIDAAGMAFGIKTVKPANDATDPNGTIDMFKGTEVVPNSIAAGQQAVVWHKPLSGLANQNLFCCEIRGNFIIVLSNSMFVTTNRFW